MLLREHLNHYTKQQLLEQARNLEIPGRSGLRKAELIEKIVESFCSENMLRERLACLTKEQMEIVRRACAEPQEISSSQLIDAMYLYRYWTGYFEEPSDKFCVFDDVAEIFRKIDDDGFREDQRKKGWMVKCLSYFINYYGIAPLEVMHQLFRLKVRCTVEEMTAMLYGMPVDVTESCIFPVKSLGMQEWTEDDPIYSRKGLLIHIPLLEEDATQDLLQKQSDKSFYIPSAKQIEEVFKMGYEASSPAYQKLEAFFMKKLSFSYEKAVSLCLRVWADSAGGDIPTDLFEEFSDEGIVFSGEAQMQEMLSLLMEAHNHTRMKDNRGHQPSELVKQNFSGGMPTIVPGSSHAAALLNEAAPQLREMGLSLDFDSNCDVVESTLYPQGLGGKPVRTQKKIYPNDPCPCGSGKKYKKCCGK